MKLQLRLLSLVVAALATAGAHPASAQESAGGYTTRVGGQPFGTETYRITRARGRAPRARAGAGDER